MTLCIKCHILYEMIVWDKEKNDILKKERNISFEDAAQIILDERYLDILENPSRKDQYVFIISLHNYIHVVLFIIDDSKNIVLKTIYPSRKFHQIYGGKL